MELPKFKYYPDPIATGSLVESATQCAACGTSRGYVHRGWVYAIGDYDERICPWCIADGTAHEKFGIAFTSAHDVGGNGWETVSKTVIEEVAYRTPGFPSLEQARWWTNCNDAAQFLGIIGGREIQTFDPAALKRIRQETCGDDEEFWEEILDIVGIGEIYQAYLFRCISCGERFAYVDVE